MNNNVLIPIASKVSIRENELDENWLHQQIIKNPSCLGLGDLEVISHERLQASGGRLDLLLKNPEDDTMYEVEIMLGETDETHIIRTIEYWDNEKRKWPQRQHYAVLVAETITRRYFNVIQLFSHSIPIIAIQVSMIEAGDQKLLHFSKILDTYEEPEDSGDNLNEVYNEDFWRNKSPSTIETAKSLLEIIKPVFENGSLNYVKNYIAIEVNNNNYMWFHKRSGNKSLLGLWISELRISQAESILEKNNISYVKKDQKIRITTDKEFIQKNADMLKEIAQLVKESWQN
jgi:hypothetical protein